MAQEKDTTTISPGPLKGVVVADFTQLAQGPWATQMLGDMGADVIKIEPPKGDWFRHYAYGNLYPQGESISFLSFNRNKRSVVLDLKSEKGREAAIRIIGRADVVVENFRPGVMDRLGIGYERLKALNPRIIYCGSSGYGPSGPYVDRPGQDLLAQSLAGGIFLNGRKGDIPVVTAVGQADLLTSLFIVQSLLAALYYRERTGIGQRIDACLLNSVIAFHIQEITAFLLKGANPERSAQAIPNPWLGAPYGLYETTDGYIAIGMNSVRRLASLAGLGKYDNERYTSNNIMEGRDEIWKDFNACFRRRTTKEWLDILLPEDIWCSQVNSFAEMVKDPQVIHNEIIRQYDHPRIGKVATTGFSVRFSETPQRIYRPAPLLGEHSGEILREYGGYSDSEIDEFFNDGAGAGEGVTK
jgi:crotonobetainyl-CoA:carnitine CoA-transferase CaiB-like acyl-CoA transferase